MRAEIPAAFSDRIRQQFPDTYSSILGALESDVPVSFRLNPKKSKVGFNLDQSIPWSKFGYYLDKRPAFIFDPYFHAGHYYPQEASSMGIELAINQIGSASLKDALDLCAAPGGKSTHLASLLPDETVLVSNEIVQKRFKILFENISKWGATNVICTQSSPDHLSAIGPVFDLVLVDAPCSGEGMFRKLNYARTEWSPAHAQQCSVRQGKILDDAIKLIRPGGHLIYSTCTFNPSENAEQIEFLQKEHGFEVITIQGLTEGIERDNAGGYMWLPDRIRGEGFYLALLQKSDEDQYFKTPKSNRNLWSQVSHKEMSQVQSFVTEDESTAYYKNEFGDIVGMHSTTSEILQLLGTVKVRCRIPLLGNLKRNTFIPAHFLVSSGLASDQINRIQVNLDEAITYLQGHPLTGSADESGWHIVEYEQAALGLAKFITPNRWNNYYPREWRIRSKIEK